MAVTYDPVAMRGASEEAAARGGRYARSLVGVLLGGLLAATGAAPAHAQLLGPLLPAPPPPPPPAAPIAPPAPAAAPAPPPPDPPYRDGIYAGGSNGEGAGVFRRGDALISVRMQDSRTVARLRVAAYARCASSSFNRVIRLRHGVLRVRLTDRYREGRVRTTAVLTIEGQLTASGGGGMYSIRFTRRNGGRTTRCSASAPWQVRWVVTQPRPRGAPSAPLPAAGYYGRSDLLLAAFPLPFVIVTDATGRAVDRVQFAFRLGCSRLGLGVRTYIQAVPGGPIGTDQRFARTTTRTLRYGDRVRGRFTIAVSGRFTTAGIVGGARVRLVFRRGGRTLGSCGSRFNDFVAAP